MNEVLISAKSKIPEILEAVPLSWAKNSKHYFENNYREYWIATIEPGVLLISGLDIDFREIRVTKEEAKREKMNLIIAVNSDTIIPIFKHTILNKCEAFWVLSIIEAFLT